MTGTLLARPVDFAAAAAGGDSPAVLRRAERHGSPGASSTDWQAGTAGSTQGRLRRCGDQNSQYATPSRATLLR